MKLALARTLSLYSVLFTMVLGLATCGWAQYTNTIDFENYTLGNVNGQFGWNGQNANATVTDVNPISGTKSLMNDGTSGNSWPYYSYGIGTYKAGSSVSVDMQVVTDTSNSLGNGFYISPSPGSATPIWISFVGGDIQAYADGQVWQTVGTYTVGDIYRIEVNNIQYNGANTPGSVDLEIIDLTTSATVVSDPTFDYSVNDIQPFAASDYAVVPASYGGGSALYDNITLISPPSPPPPPPPTNSSSITIDFENYALGDVDGQFGWNGQNALATVTNVDPISGTQSLYNNENNNPSWPFYSYGVGKFTNGCDVSVEMKVVGDTSSSIGNGFYISPGPGGPSPIWVSFVGGSIKTYLYDTNFGYYWQTLGGYTVGDVYRIDVSNIQITGTNVSANNTIIGTFSVGVYDLTTSQTVVPISSGLLGGGFQDWATGNYAVVVAGYGLGGSALYDNIIFTPPQQTPSVLSILPPSVPGEFVVQLTGETNVTYVLQSSPDLYSWTSVATDTLSGSVLNITNTVPQGTSQQFWRAFSQP